MVDLRTAGLTDNESKVYLALLDLGPALAGQIARKSGLHRRTVYDTTEMLIQKGLIGYILQNNRRVFSASNPERILDILHEKESVLSPFISQLQEKYHASKSKDETLFFKGREGLKTVFEDQLNYSEVLVLGANKDASQVLPFYFKWYNQKRSKKKIHLKVIASSRSISKIPHSTVRFLPEKYANPLAINIYGDKTAIILWSKVPHVIVIKSKEISEGYRNYFNLLWRIAKE